MRSILVRLLAVNLAVGSSAQTIQTGSPTIANAQEHFFQSNGVRIRYLIAGRGEPVLLVHGWSASADMWEALMDDLSRDHQVIAMDCRGHGRSDKPHDPSQYGNEMAADVVRLMDHLTLKRAHVVGYSMGGGIVMKVLVDHPDRLLSAVAGGSAGFREGDEEWDAGLIKDLATGMPLSDAMIANRPTGSPEPSVQQREMMRQMDAMQDSKALAAQRRGNVGLRISNEPLQRNRVPLLVIYGGRDAPERFEPYKTIIANAEFAMVDGVGHGGVPDSPVFVQRVRDFLARHSGGRL